MRQLKKNEEEEEQSVLGRRALPPKKQYDNDGDDDDDNHLKSSKSRSRRGGLRLHIHHCSKVPAEGQGLPGAYQWFNLAYPGRIVSDNSLFLKN